MKKTILVTALLGTIHFWGYYRFSSRMNNLTDLLLLALFGFSMVKVIQDNALRFKGAIILFLVGIFCNILSANFNNGQSPKDTFLSFGYFYFILFYFFLHDYKPDRKFLEDLIITFAVLYAAMHLIQVAAFPRRLFSGNLFADRGTIRIRMQGGTLLILGYFLLINRYLYQRKITDLLVALFFFYIMLHGGFRTFVVAAVLLSGIMFIKLVKYSPVNYLLIIAGVVGFIVLLQFGTNSTVINGMLNASEKQKQMGERYIRVMEYDYFTQAYPQNFSYYIFGGGLPGSRGEYAHKMGFLVSEYGFYFSDLGLVGFYFVIGLITGLGIVWYSLKAIFTKLPPDRFYLNIYFAYLILVSAFTTDEIYTKGIFSVQAIVLYLIDITRNEMAEEKTKAKEIITE